MSMNGQMARAERIAVVMEQLRDGGRRRGRHYLGECAERRRQRTVNP